MSEPDIRCTFSVRDPEDILAPTMDCGGSEIVLRQIVQDQSKLAASSPVASESLSHARRRGLVSPCRETAPARMRAL